MTLNPVSHIDPIGTIILPALSIITGAPLIGWAKPVPVNPYNMSNPYKDMVLVSVAGPFANIVISFFPEFDRIRGFLGLSPYGEGVFWQKA